GAPPLAVLTRSPEASNTANEPVLPKARTAPDGPDRPEARTAPDGSDTPRTATPLVPSSTDG
ncbi:hypothetical protein ACWEEL_39090, partial [Streptomyces sp. NPDC005009]